MNARKAAFITVGAVIALLVLIPMFSEFTLIRSNSAAIRSGPSNAIWEVLCNENTIVQEAAAQNGQAPAAPEEEEQPAVPQPEEDDSVLPPEEDSPTPRPPEEMEEPVVAPEKEVKEGDEVVPSPVAPADPFKDCLRICNSLYPNPEDLGWWLVCMRQCEASPPSKEA